MTPRAGTGGPSEPDLVGIAAVARNGVIGADRDIPWRVPADWRRFQALTSGHVLVMGRRTYDSIGRPLPDRTTVVVTRDTGWGRDGVLVAPSPERAVTLARAYAAGPVFVAGGGELYRALWPRLGRLEITEVDQAPVGDVCFPEISARDWDETAREPYDGYTFVSYRRHPA